MGTFNMLRQLLLGAHIAIISFVLIFFRSFTHFHWTVAQWLGHQTCDREIARSTPGWCIAG